ARHRRLRGGPGGGVRRGPRHRLGGGARRARGRAGARPALPSRRAAGGRRRPAGPHRSAGRHGGAGGRPRPGARPRRGPHPRPARRGDARRGRGPGAAARAAARARPAGGALPPGEPAAGPRARGRGARAAAGGGGRRLPGALLPAGLRARPPRPALRPGRRPRRRPARLPRRPGPRLRAPRGRGGGARRPGGALRVADAPVSPAGGRLPPYRAELPFTYAFGRFAVLEALTHRPDDVTAVLWHARLPDTERERLLAAAARAGVAARRDDATVARLRRKESVHCLAVVAKREERLAEAADHVALVRPSHPGNVGSAIRSLVAFGFGDLALVAPAVDAWGPYVVRASVGLRFAVRCQA